MEIFIEKQLLSVGYSFILGLIFGTAYDIIKIIYILCGIASYSGKLKHMSRGFWPWSLCLIFDMIYMSAVTVTFSAFVYYANYGDFRWYLAVGAVAGFVAYHYSLGVPVMFFSEAIVRLLRLIIRYTVVVPGVFVASLAASVAKWAYGHTVGQIVSQIRWAVSRKRNARHAKQLEFDIKFSEKL